MIPKYEMWGDEPVNSALLSEEMHLDEVIDKFLEVEAECNFDVEEDYEQQELGVILAALRVY